MEYSYKKTAAAVIIITLLLSSLLIIISYRSSNKPVTSYVLKSDNGTVALYNGEKLVEVYDGIVVDSLPYEDRIRLDKGITVDGIEDAQSIIEDYDG